MKITIAGTPGSGKSTVAREVAHKLKFRHYSIGDLMRQIAKKRKVSLLKLSKIAENDNGNVDRELDAMQLKLGKKENFVIDSRLGFHFIPDSIKIFLHCNDQEAAKRIFSHLREDERENTTIAKTLANLKRRKKSEKIRYKKYYNIDISSKRNFGLVIDTTNISANQVIKKIILYVKAKK